MPKAFPPLHEYPYRYAPPIGVTQVSYPPRRSSPTLRALVPDAAAMRYNVGGFNPGVSTACYARPKDLHALSLQPFDLAVPGLETLPLDATLPTLRPEIMRDAYFDFDDEDEDDDAWEEAYAGHLRRRGSRQAAAPAPAPAPAAPAQAPARTGKPLGMAIQSVASLPGQIVDAASRGAREAREFRHAQFQPPQVFQPQPPPPHKDNEALKLVAVGLAGLVGGVIIGSMLSRRS